MQLRTLTTEHERVSQLLQGGPVVREEDKVSGLGPDTGHPGPSLKGSQCPSRRIPFALVFLSDLSLQCLAKSSQLWDLRQLGLKDETGHWRKHRHRM